MNNNRTKLTIAAASGVAALALGGGAVANATGGEENDKPIPAAQYQQAADAALAAVPGKVTETEVGDEEGAYEVEVTRAGGGEVDVHLDKQFNVIGKAADKAGAGDKE